MDKSRGQQPNPAEPDIKTQKKDTSPEPEFKTPEEVAEQGKPHETGQADTDLGAVALAAAKFKTAKHRFKDWALNLRPATKRQKITGGIIAVVILILGIAAVQAINGIGQNVEGPNAVIKKSTEPSKLTGIEIDPDINKRKVIGVMIENSPDARPQAGINQAGVVFEAIAEGGITRFCALFLENQPDYLGPVRSVRPYYMDWLAGFDAAVGHAGGSAQGLAKVANLNIDDLDYTKANSYHRVNDRFAPHNLYTSVKSLQQETKKKGFKTSKFEGFKRKPELKNVGKPKVKNIAFNISTDLYNVRYVYDKQSNNYSRFMGGQAHRDHRTGKPIKPKIVIGLITQYSTSGIYSVYKTGGKGKVIIFQNGKAQQGTWKKAGPKKPLQFFDKKGEPLRLNPGKTWITALKSKHEAKYGP
jgi:hypothetical protein